MELVDKFNTYRAGYNSNTDNPVCNTKIELTDIADESIIPDSKDGKELRQTFDFIF